MKTILLSLAALTVALIPSATTTAAQSVPIAPIATNGLNDPHAHGWYVHYRHHGPHSGHHAAGPFASRHAADDYAHQLRHQGYHVERIAHQ